MVIIHIGIIIIDIVERDIVLSNTVCCFYFSFFKLPNEFRKKKKNINRSVTTDSWLQLIKMPTEKYFVRTVKETQFKS